MLRYLCNDLSQMHEMWKKLGDISWKLIDKNANFLKITSNKRKNEENKMPSLFLLKTVEYFAQKYYT